MWNEAKTRNYWSYLQIDIIWLVQNPTYLKKSICTCSVIGFIYLIQKHVYKCAFIKFWNFGFFWFFNLERPIEPFGFSHWITESGVGISEILNYNSDKPRWISYLFETRQTLPARVQVLPAHNCFSMNPVQLPNINSHNVPDVFLDLLNLLLL